MKRRRETAGVDAPEIPMPVAKTMMGKRHNAPQDIATPDWLVALIRHHWGDYFDPCPLNPKADALSKSFEWHALNYVNPPYNNIFPWVKRAHNEVKRGKTTVMLIPTRPNMGYWVQYIDCRAKVITILGNVKFKGYPRHFPHSLSLIVFAPHMPKRVILESTTVFRKIDVHRNAIGKRVMKEHVAEHLLPQVCVNGVDVGVRYWRDYVQAIVADEDEEEHAPADMAELKCLECSRRHINRKFDALGSEDDTE